MIFEKVNVNEAVYNESIIFDIFYKKLPKICYAGNFKYEINPQHKIYAQCDKYLQFNGAFLNWIVLDVDRDVYLEECVSPNAPKPNFLVQNIENRKAHLFYYLKNPVCKTDAAHFMPLNYYNDVRASLTHYWGADLAYGAFIGKNPLSTKFITYPLREEGYKLGELIKYGNPTQIKNEKKFNECGTGRNCTLFEAVRQIAYKEVKRVSNQTALFNIVLYELNNLNLFKNPLPISEIRVIASSITRWTWRKFNDVESQKKWGSDNFYKNNNSEIQKERNAKSIIVRATKAEMLAELVKADFETGQFTRQELMEKYDIKSRQTLLKYLK